MFRLESTFTSRPPTVLSKPPSSPPELDGTDCTITFTRASPGPERISCCRSGEILLLLRFCAGAALAARTVVLVEIKSAEQREASTESVTRRFRSWGRDIQFLQGATKSLNLGHAQKSERSPSATSVPDAVCWVDCGNY